MQDPVGTPEGEQARSPGPVHIAPEPPAVGNDQGEPGHPRILQMGRESPGVKGNPVEAGAPEPEEVGGAEHGLDHKGKDLDLAHAREAHPRVEEGAEAPDQDADFE